MSLFVLQMEEEEEEEVTTRFLALIHVLLQDPDQRREFFSVRQHRSHLFVR